LERERREEEAEKMALPPGEEKKAASACTSGSLRASAARTLCRSERKEGFVVKLSGVGGRVVVVPRARVGLAGSVGRRERRWVEGLEEGWMY
jgi:hypothetical protein